MDIGALEYVVIGVADDPFTEVILPELHALQGAGHLRVVDLLFVQKQADGTTTTREVRDMSAADAQRYAGMADDLTGLLTAQDIDDLAGTIPAGTSAVIVLFEHTWALGLTAAIRQAGGVCFAGGLVAPDVLQQISAELAAQEAQNA